MEEPLQHLIPYNERQIPQAIPWLWQQLHEENVFDSVFFTVDAPKTLGELYDWAKQVLLFFVWDGEKIVGAVWFYAPTGVYIYFGAYLSRSRKVRGLVVWQEVVALAKNVGYKGILANCREDNKQVIAHFRRVGYQDVFQLPDGVREGISLYCFVHRFEGD